MMQKSVSLHNMSGCQKLPLIYAGIIFIVFLSCAVWDRISTVIFPTEDFQGNPINKRPGSHGNSEQRFTCPPQEDNDFKIPRKKEERFSEAVFFTRDRAAVLSALCLESGNFIEKLLKPNGATRPFQLRFASNSNSQQFAEALCIVQKIHNLCLQLQEDQREAEVKIPSCSQLLAFLAALFAVIAAIRVLWQNIGNTENAHHHNHHHHHRRHDDEHHSRNRRESTKAELGQHQAWPDNRRVATLYTNRHDLAFDDPCDRVNDIRRYSRERKRTPISDLSSLSTSSIRRRRRRRKSGQQISDTGTSTSKTITPNLMPRDNVVSKMKKSSSSSSSSSTSVTQISLGAMRSEGGGFISGSDNTLADVLNDDDEDQQRNTHLQTGNESLVEVVKAEEILHTRNGKCPGILTPEAFDDQGSCDSSHGNSFEFSTIIDNYFPEVDHHPQKTIDVEATEDTKSVQSTQMSETNAEAMKQHYSRNPGGDNNTDEMASAINILDNKKIPEDKIARTILSNSSAGDYDSSAVKYAIFSWCQRHQLLPKSCPSCGENFEPDSSFPSYKLCHKCSRTIPVKAASWFTRFPVSSMTAFAAMYLWSTDIHYKQASVLLQTSLQQTLQCYTACRTICEAALDICCFTQQSKTSGNEGVKVHYNQDHDFFQCPNFKLGLPGSDAVELEILDISWPGWVGFPSYAILVEDSSWRCFVTLIQSRADVPGLLTNIVTEGTKVKLRDERDFSALSLPSGFSYDLLPVGQHQTPPEVRDRKLAKIKEILDATAADGEDPFDEEKLKIQLVQLMWVQQVHKEAKRDPFKVMMKKIKYDSLPPTTT